MRLIYSCFPRSYDHAPTNSVTPLLKNVRSVNTRISLLWPNCLVNSVDKTKHSVLIGLSCEWMESSNFALTSLKKDDPSEIMDQRVSCCVVEE